MKKNADPALMAAPEYRRFIEDLKARGVSARIGAARAVNRDLILLYWDIGSGIVERQKTLGWGDAVVEMVAADLRRAFPGMSGFSLANVWRMRQLYMVYSNEAVLAQAAREFENRASRKRAPSFLGHVVSEGKAMQVAAGKNLILARAVRELAAAVPWGHHVLLIGKIKSPPELFYYLCATAQFGWSRNVLLNQIKAGAYERSVVEKKTHNFDHALPVHLSEQADEMLKSSYSLEFLGIRRALKERELEDQLISRLQSFLLELGYGFCFVGRQHRLALKGKEYFIDLLFYHRFLKAHFRHPAPGPHHLQPERLL